MALFIGTQNSANIGSRFLYVKQPTMSYLCEKCYKTTL